MKASIDLTQLQKLELINMDIDVSEYPIKNSFRLTFKDGESIDFYADNREMQEKWFAVLKDVMDHIPEHLNPVDGVEMDDVEMDRRSSEKPRRRVGTGRPPTIPISQPPVSVFGSSRTPSVARFA